MPYELILSTDTLDQGRIKVNSFVNSTTGVWSSDTINYSIFSRIGGSNYNFAFGNYGLVVGVNNSAVTGDYSCLIGGKTNYTRASFNLIGNGVNNQIRNASSTYSSILNGSANQIGITTLSKYSTVINGKTNKIYGGNYNIANGNGNTIYGTSNLVFGANNKIKKSASNPSRNFIVGDGNVVSGSSTVRDNLVIGINNVVVNTLPGGTATASFSNYNSVVGGDNRIYRGGASTFHGIFLTNLYNSSTPKNDIHMFGRGSNSSTPLRPVNSYSMIMGTSATRRIRIEFGTSPSSINLIGPGSFNQSGADYGEFFEWEDGNQNDEKRVGYFVGLSNGKIKISDNLNTIGIISTTTAFIGDSNQDYWNEMHLKDEWGNVLIEKYYEYNFEINGETKTVFYDENEICYENIPCPENTNKIIIDGLDKKNGIFVKEREQEIFNPNYNHSINYIPRDKRKEWDVVGLLGKLRVRTSEQITGNFVDVDTNTGMAKNGTTYPVLNKFKDFDGNYGIVLIFFK
jgi:hypothetical protein